MQRWKLTLEYDGTPFNGWQRQPDESGVQDAVEIAFSKFCGARPATRVAGRTDAGVHARGQVIQVDIERPFTGPRLCDALNAHLRDRAVAALHAETVEDDFDARFSARLRHYEYIIINRPTPLTIMQHRAWQIRKTLSLTAMQDGARYFLGQHDFTSFRAISCQAKHALRSIDYFTVAQTDDQIIFRVGARSFLQHQVRNMVGTLTEIGKGKRAPEDIQTILAARDRAQAGMTAPPDGLYFTQVDY